MFIRKVNYLLGIAFRLQKFRKFHSPCQKMSDLPIQIELSELKGRVISLERDTTRVLDAHTKHIDRQERANETIELQVKALQLSTAISEADDRNQSKLKWIILAAIATQFVTLLTPYLRPAPTTIPEATRTR